MVPQTVTFKKEFVNARNFQENVSKITCKMNCISFETLSTSRSYEKNFPSNSSMPSKMRMRISMKIFQIQQLHSSSTTGIEY